MIPSNGDSDISRIECPELQKEMHDECNPSFGNICCKLYHILGIHAQQYRLTKPLCLQMRYWKDDANDPTKMDFLTRFYKGHN
jgi:hypothetical protein